ncbi:MAG: TetR/AcrR family transcriptional repressor of nem operon [Planctomycetota bacterium]|jgi:AcrR family transcriptional regulator|uniref:TetR/AcrR family transcriptional regulator n=1 Tax=Patiriisocius sp. Uisw_047 TaxID=3230969 RepID=UPI0039E7ADF0
MRNAVSTKELIIKESANLFNKQGYKATSISDITKATGLTKGAIYRHFENKSDLEQQALRSLAKLMFTELGAQIMKANTFQDKMDATFAFFERYMETPLYEGGCPLLNAATEVDDTNVVLRQQTFYILAQFKASVQKIIENGIKNNQVSSITDAPFYATIFIATLEGGIMMSRLERTPDAILKTVAHLRNVVKEISN